MRWSGRRESSNVEDRRGMDEGGGGGLGGLGGLGGGGFGRGGMGIPIGRGGGITGLIIVGVILVGGWLLGVDPSAILSGGSTDDQGSGVSQTTGRVGAPSDDPAKFVATVLADTEDVWTGIFQKMGKTYTLPTLVLFNGATRSGCGFAQAAVGPFYCPEDHKLYIDLDFYDELTKRFGAPGDFAEAYVIAHEVGHHVQNLLGTLPKVHQQMDAQGGGSGAEGLSVRLELQADCYAGIWAHAEEANNVLDPGDIDEALNAASAVGDNKIEQQTQGRVVPDSFTHGTSAQRSRWFKQGYTQGTLDACDTFSGSI